MCITVLSMADPELEHPTWEEIDALAQLSREREEYLRPLGLFNTGWQTTDAIESLLGKLRRNYHELNRRAT